jgi:hypothetical protein
MATEKNACFPYHLGKLVARRLEAGGYVAPPDAVLQHLFETLYFASLKTDEARQCTCTVNFVDPSASARPSTRGHNNGWSIIPFSEPIPLNVRTLLKLGEAVDPDVSSIAVFVDCEGDLFIWGLVDQELRYGDYVSLDGSEDPIRPGLFQATITGVGGVCVYQNFTLLGSLEQNVLVKDYHDVLWDGPVHRRLCENLNATLQQAQIVRGGGEAQEHLTRMQEELTVRWQNAICRVLYNIQHYSHGGGIIIDPQVCQPDLHVKYETTYDRLPKALLRLAKHQILKRQLAETIATHCDKRGDMLPRDFHLDALDSQTDLERLKNELLGCVRFIASLSRVDGFILMDNSLVVHGFGVEARADSDLETIHIAGDAKASAHLLRESPLSQFGTRHRAMMRYCDRHDQALGLVISQDGDIRATMKYRGRLVLWENINAQLAYRAENRGALINNFSPGMTTGLFHQWMRFVNESKTA